MKKSLYLIIAAGLLFSSCGMYQNYTYNSRDISGYVPTVANVNTNTEKGSFSATGFVGFNHGELAMNYNVSDHLYVQTNGYLSGFYKNCDGALGYTVSSKNTKLFSTQSIGYGYGAMDLGMMKIFNTGAGPIQSGQDNDVYIRKTDASYSMNRCYLQSTIGINIQQQSFSLGGKLNLLSYNDYHFRIFKYRTLESRAPSYDPISTLTPLVPAHETNLARKNSQVLDVFLTWNSRRNKPLNIYLQCLFSTPLNQVDQRNEHHLIDKPGYPLLSAGLAVNLRKKSKS